MALFLAGFFDLSYFLCDIEGFKFAHRKKRILSIDREGGQAKLLTSFSN
jgi:hypothetical protein